MSLKSIHWNQKVVILTTFLSLAAPEVVILTTSGATSDEKVVNMMTFCFQCFTMIQEESGSSKQQNRTKP